MLKAVLEQDHPTNRPMLLCISAIAYKGDGQVLHEQPQEGEQQKEAVRSAGNQAQVQLTDGWYGVKAVLDPALTRLLQAGNIRLGACPAAPAWNSRSMSHHSWERYSVLCAGGILVRHRACLQQGV